MYYGLYLSAAGATAQGQKVEVLSNNLANVDTVGFKRDLALLESRDSEAIERGMASRGSRSLNDIGGGTGQNQTSTDFHVGNIRPTGIQTDMALETANSFFVVQHGDQQLLTRAGNFQLGGEGELQTREGDPVLSSDGSPIQIDGRLPWELLPGGVISQAGGVRQLALVQADRLSNLTKVGQNYFSAPENSQSPVPDEDRRVRRGVVEMSGVNPIQEMVELISAQRAFETSTRMIQNHDSMTSSLISRMLRV
ncbi:MAG: flagellar hook-basal body protein [Pirellulaceae bacterium]